MSDALNAKASSEMSSFEQLKTLIVEEFGPDAADDDRISRFLRAREFDVRQGYLMLKKNLQWREKYNINTIVQDYNITELHRNYFPSNPIGSDKEGSPLIVVNFGKLDFKGFTKVATAAENILYFVHDLELCEKKMREDSQTQGKVIDKWCAIANMEGFSFSKVSSREVIAMGIDACLCYDAHYPERLKSAYVVNVPTSFKLLLSLVKPFIASKTQQKIKFYGKDGWKEELLKHIDPSVLPAYLGGDRTDPDGNPMCHSFVCHGGLVPESFYSKKSGKRYLRNQQGVNSLVLKRRSKLSLPFDVHQNGSLIKWEFELDGYDISFGLYYKAFDSMTEDELLPLLPLQRVDSSMLSEAGTFNCEMHGTYILTLDNSYSFFRSKTIFYKVSVTEPSVCNENIDSSK